MTELRRDIVGVGAGPVGLSLALGLARTDLSVLVLEKEDGLSEHSRAPIIWPRTQEVLAGLDVMDRFQEAGIVRSRLQLWDADRDEVLLRVPIEGSAEKKSVIVWAPFCSVVHCVSATHLLAK